MTRRSLRRFALLISLGLAGCAGSQQERLAKLSEGRAGCPAGEMVISDVKGPRVPAGNEQYTWTVACRGHRFLCSSWTESGDTSCAPEVPPAPRAP